jgi:hypothetical protein
MFFRQTGVGHLHQEKVCTVFDENRNHLYKHIHNNVVVVVVVIRRSSQIVHRDLAARNILLDSTLSPKAYDRRSSINRRHCQLSMSMSLFNWFLLYVLVFVVRSIDVSRSLILVSLFRSTIVFTFFRGYALTIPPGMARITDESEVSSTKSNGDKKKKNFCLRNTTFKNIVGPLKWMVLTTIGCQFFVSFMSPFVSFFCFAFF